MVTLIPNSQFLKDIPEADRKRWADALAGDNNALV